MPLSRALTEPVAEPTRSAEACAVDAEPFTEPLAEPLADTPVLAEGTVGLTAVSPPPLTEAVMVAGCVQTGDDDDLRRGSGLEDPRDGVQPAVGGHGQVEE